MRARSDKRVQLGDVRKAIDSCERLLKVQEIQYGLLGPSEKSHYGSKVESMRSYVLG